MSPRESRGASGTNCADIVCANAVNARAIQRLLFEAVLPEIRVPKQ